LEVAVIVSIIAGTVSIIGWIINHILADYREEKKQNIMRNLENINQQLSELYGPLVFLCYEGQISFNDLREIITKNNKDIKDADNIKIENQKLWQFWVENDFFPRNEKMLRILMEKTHLIEGAKLPVYIIQFIEHYNSWKIAHERWKKEGIEYSGSSKIEYPSTFDEEIIKTFSKLKQLQNKYLTKIKN